MPKVRLMHHSIANLINLYDTITQVEFNQRRNEAYMLASCLLGVARSQLITYPHKRVSAQKAALFIRAVERRLQGEPLAYILGKWGFYEHSFIVNSSVLIPRPETECIVDWLLDNLFVCRPLRLLEIGSGSGAIAISIASQRPKWHITATDISAAALELAKTNAKKVSVKNIKFLVSDIFSRLKRKLAFDVIVANLPYIAKAELLGLPELRDEPRIALTDEADGMTLIEHLYKEAVPHLKTRGQIIVEHAKGQDLAVRHLARRLNYVNLRSIQDLSGGVRALVATYL